jgi:tight adherence protein C
METLYLISGGAFAAVVLLAVGAFAIVRQQAAGSAIAASVRRHTSPLGKEEAPLDPGRGAVWDRVVGITEAIGNAAKPKKSEDISVLRKRFTRAGLRSRNAVVVFFGLKVILALCLSIGFVALRVFAHWQMTPMNTLVLTIILLAAGFYLPDIWLRLRTSRRQEDFMLGFPDALDLLVVCAEAGMGIDAAMKRVGDEMRLSSKVVSEEFGILNLELRAGKTRRDAMKSMADRVGLDDVNSLVTLLIQTDRFGTSVAQALRVHADSMRTKRSQRVEEIAAKLPVKLLFPTILFIFPSLFLVLIGPALIRAYRIWSGH